MGKVIDYLQVIEDFCDGKTNLTEQARETLRNWLHNDKRKNIQIKKTIAK